MGGFQRIARFVAVGVASTLAYVLIYLALRRGLAAQPANAISMLITAIGNTAVNRRVTFGISGREHAVRHQLRGLIAFAAGLAVTTGALAMLHCDRGPAEPGRGAGRPARGQPGGHPGPVRALPQLGLPRRARSDARLPPAVQRRAARGGRGPPAGGPGIGLAACWPGTALLYLSGLSRNGWANDFYAAAVQAGTRSWKAFFFGSFDSSNFITVDKTPASLWVMEMSGRVFGFSYWAMLVPQALEGVASVAVLYATVKRWFGPGAGLLAGAALALTPVAALMFRFNNPDALLVLLMTAAGLRVTRRGPRAGRDPVAGAGRGPARPGRSWPRCCRRSWSCPASGWPT